MIVFTATNLRTHDVYVGTARESVEEEWADLLSQADSGTSGQFFQQLRDYGATAFEVDTWAYGENAAEARESMREAREELGAQPIKSVRAQSAGRSTQAIQSASMKALMAVFEEALSNDAPLDDDDLLDGLLPDTAGDKSTALLDADDEQAEEEDEVDEEIPVRASRVTAKSASAPTPAAPSVPAPAPAPAVGEEPKTVSRLDAMKAAQERLLRERDTRIGAQKPAKTNSVATSSGERAAQAKAAKIASGRTGSAEKERRIRAAIEAERERRDSLRHTNTRDEQTEMNVVMARIEMRRLAAKKANAEKSKVQAAERRAKAKAEANLAKEALASALRRENAVTQPSASSALRAVDAPAILAKTENGQSAAVKTAADRQVPANAADRAALKLAEGRTGSGQKEKRIREAIEQEKAHRLAQQQARRAAEAKEMADIMARLEERTKAAEKLKRRR